MTAKGTTNIEKKLKNTKKLKGSTNSKILLGSKKKIKRSLNNEDTRRNSLNIVKYERKPKLGQKNMFRINSIWKTIKSLAKYQYQLIFSLLSLPWANENLNYQTFGLRPQKLTTNTGQIYKSMQNSEIERCRNAWIHILWKQKNMFNYKSVRAVSVRFLIIVTLKKMKQKQQQKWLNMHKNHKTLYEN